jgi:hypothetical protein
MLKLFSLACRGLLPGVLGCAVDVAPVATSDQGPSPAAPTAEGQSFEAQLPGDITAETVIPAIVAAGRVELAAACATAPGASIRVMNPLASSAFEDVSCSSVLQSLESTAATSASFTGNDSDGPIGTAQQKWSPFGVGCTVAVGLAALVATYALCPRATNPQDEKHCGYVTNGGFTGLGVMCAFI